VTLFVYLPISCYRSITFNVTN